VSRAGWLALALVAIAAAPGCQLVFTGDGDDDDIPPCHEGAIAPPLELRNPYTGQCDSEPLGCSGQGGDGDLAAPWIDPRWPLCYSGACEALDEGTCQLADGCRAIDTAPSENDGPTEFAACWPTAQDGPVRGGDCTQITDAFECSQHDDCATLHVGNDSGLIADFLACLPEPAAGCYADEDCSSDSHCSVSDGECLPPPHCLPGEEPCDDVCYGRWVPDEVEMAPACGVLDESSCIDRADGCHDWSDPYGGCGDLCGAHYQGVDCGCDGDVCSCQDWTFLDCATL
jgi:hypothetical protein